MANENILIILSDPENAQYLENNTLHPAGYEVKLVSDCQSAESLIKADLPDLVILGDPLVDGSELDLAARLQDQYPDLPIILFTNPYQELMVLKALRHGFCDYFYPPLVSEVVLQAVDRGLQHRKRWNSWAHLESRRATKSLRRRIDGLETLQRIGRVVTALLDLDSVLTAVVDAAVEITGAEEVVCCCWTITAENCTCARRATSRMISCALSACPRVIPWQARYCAQVSL